MTIQRGSLVVGSMGVGVILGPSPEKGGGLLFAELRTNKVITAAIHTKVVVLGQAELPPIDGPINALTYEEAEAIRRKITDFLPQFIFWVWEQFDSQERKINFLAQVANLHL